MSIRLLPLLLATLLLAGCSLYLPGVGIEVGGHDDHGSGFCPPGQAKKGNC